MNLVPAVQSKYATNLMAEYPHLDNAPITEALIDLRVTASAELSIESLQQSLETADFGYFIKGPISQGSVEFTMLPDGTLPATKSLAAKVGFRLHSADERYVALWQLNGFTLSRLPPYENWDTLLTEFKRLWDIYRKLTKPQRVARVATRYINNLKLPLAAGAPIGQYLDKVVELPAGVPQSIEGFLQRFLLVDDKSEARVILTLALKGASAGEPVPVVLDIDTSVATDMAIDDGHVWQKLAELHELKNRVFFNTIKRPALELYL